MPLLDHHHPPLIRTHPRRSFHSAWAAAMARLLNAGVLPPGYYALPNADRDGPIEVDVAALQLPGSADAPAERPWAPSDPPLSVATAWPGTDEVNVEIVREDGDPRLAAAVELISPRNEDRATAREAFAHKCANQLNRGCGLVVVDAVTTRRANVHAGIFTAVGAEAPAALPPGLSAVSYRALGGETDGQLQAWPAALAVGEPLPTLPLWLGALAVPLDLEASYTAACADLRIRQGTLRALDGSGG